MRKETKICTDCGKVGVDYRNRYTECVKKYNKQRAKDYYKKVGKKRRKENLPKGICVVCGKDMIMWRKDQVKHKNCIYPNNRIDYNKIPRTKNGR